MSTFGVRRAGPSPRYQVRAGVEAQATRCASKASEYYVREGSSRLLHPSRAGWKIPPSYRRTFNGDQHPASREKTVRANKSRLAVAVTVSEALGDGGCTPCPSVARRPLR